MSRTQGIIRLKPLRAALRLRQCSATAGLASLLLCGAGAWADTPGWDCRMAPDGQGWECSSGRPVAGGLSTPPVSNDATSPSETRPAPDEAPSAPAGSRPPAASDADAPTPPRPAPSAQPAASGSSGEAGPAPYPAPVTTTPRFSNGTGAPAPEAPSVDAAARRAFEDPAIPDLVAPATTAEAPKNPDQAPGEPSVSTAAERPLAGGIDAGIDWDVCRISPPAQAGAGEGPDRTLPVAITADAVVAELGPEQAVFSGDVQLVQGSLELRADQLTFDRSSGEIHAEGGLLFRQPDIRVAGSAATYQLATGQGLIEQASYRIPAVPARGDAERAELLGESRSRFEQISYTTCAPGKEDWLLTAEALELDREEGVGRANHAKLRFMGVPFLYAPVLSFPIDDRRRSGLLVPSIGQSENTGFDLSVPYYLNLAPNYDLTLTPRLMSKRGLMLGGEFRFLTSSSKGELITEYMPNDSERGDARGSASLRTRTTFNPQSSANLRLNYVSDSDYLNDFGESLAVTSATHLERTGEIFYRAKTWDSLARVQYYQTIDDAIAPANRPYSRLPQLAAQLRDPGGLMGLTYHLDAEYVNFHRSDSVRGHRVDLFPALSLPLRESWGFVEPKIGANYTAYRLTDQPTGLDDSPSNLSPVASLDSGLFFDRPASYFGNAATHTLEPRLFYLFVPRNDQDDQPVFDTGLLDFRFENLFRENRFNGPDRLGDANQVTLALTSRVISDATGAELLSASLGQILYFADREVTLPGMAAKEDSSSSVVGELAASLGGGWATRLGLQWDPHEDDDGPIRQALTQITYRDTDRHVFNAAYRLRDGVTEQTDLAVFWPVNERFSVIGRHNYSLQDNRLLEAIAGIEYGRCCWRFRALVRQYSDSTTDDDKNLAFLLQLELNGLGRFGDDIESTLERGIYGYGTYDYE